MSDIEYRVLTIVEGSIVVFNGEMLSEGRPSF